AIAAGADHALALKSDGTVFGWGSDNNGQSTGVVVPGSTNGLVAFSGQVLSNVVAIAAGDGFSLGLRSDGTVVGWGQNTSGQASGVAVPAVSFVLGATVTLGGQVLSNVVALSAGN